MSPQLGETLTSWVDAQRQPEPAEPKLKDKDGYHLFIEFTGNTALDKFGIAYCTGDKDEHDLFLTQLSELVDGDLDSVATEEEIKDNYQRRVLTIADVKLEEVAFVDPDGKVVETTYEAVRRDSNPSPDPSAVA